MNILVVGSTGSIGAKIFKIAQQIVFTRGTSTSGLPPLMCLNLGEPDKFDYGIIHSGDVVLLTAAISSPDICAREHDRAWTVNVIGTSVFIEKVIAKGGRIIFFSSDTVYGEKDEPFDEMAICNPAGEYAEMKHAVEKRFLGQSLFKSIRLSYVFSCEDKFTRYLSGCAERNEEAEIFHPFYRAVIYRSDVVQGVIALSQRWDEISQPVINFGGTEVLARTDFAEKLRAKALPKLLFRITEPESQFFRNRPRVIRMMSPILPLLLGRPAHALCEATSMEFNLFKGEKRK